MRAHTGLGQATLLLTSHDAAGRPRDLSRDIVRRTYTGLTELSRMFYHVLPGVDRIQERGPSTLSVAFMEPRTGDLLFIVDSVSEDRARDMMPTDLPEEQEEAHRDLAGQVVRDVLALVEATAFTLSAEQLSWRMAPGSMALDLTDADTGRRMRVIPEVAPVLQSGIAAGHLRDVLCALGEEGVAALSLGPGPDSPRRQVDFMVGATDQLVDFLGGADLPALPAPDGPAEGAVR